MNFNDYFTSFGLIASDLLFNVEKNRRFLRSGEDCNIYNYARVQFQKMELQIQDYFGHHILLSNLIYDALL